MRHAARHLVLSCTLGTGLLLGGLLASPASAQSCDPSYPEVCLPAYPDLDCADIGFPISVIHDPSIGAHDPYGLDADYDGIGCEAS